VDKKLDAAARCRASINWQYQRESLHSSHRCAMDFDNAFCKAIFTKNE
jgi:hypothetical protein